jgi:hypothetical protein
MNVFQLSYEARLRSWYDLRSQIEQSDTKTKCVEIDKWWQKAPLVNHHLHILDSESWPDPWELLVENTYCTVARALGMCYTLLLLGITDIELVEATDKNGEDVVLVLVDSAKYVLNYWPETVVNNYSKDFTIKRKIDLTDLQLKIGAK